VCDKPVRTEETVGASREATTSSQRKKKSFERFAQKRGDSISIAWKTLPDDLSLFPHTRTADLATVGRRNSERLQVCERVRSATGGQTVCLACHTVLR
jgi:hypothetical protein